MVQKPLIKQGYSLAEEIANSVSHGIGLVFGIVGLVLATVKLEDGQVVVQVVMNNDMEPDSIFRVRDDANTLRIEPLPYSLEE